MPVLRRCLARHAGVFVPLAHSAKALSDLSRLLLSVRGRRWLFLLQVLLLLCVLHLHLLGLLLVNLLCLLLADFVRVLLR